jgi:hypothetical protein
MKILSDSLSKLRTLKTLTIIFFVIKFEIKDLNIFLIR